MVITPFDWAKHHPEATLFSRMIYWPDLWEDPETYRTKLRAFPEGCLACEDEERTVGYAFGHPWSSDRIFDIDSHLVLPTTPDCYYIHDVAVHPGYRRKGVGTLLAEAQLKVGFRHGFSEFKLISVLGSHGFWGKFGFVALNEVPYGRVTGIVMMMKRDLPSPRLT